MQNYAVQSNALLIVLIWGYRPRYIPYNSDGIGCQYNRILPIFKMNQQQMQK